MSFSIQIPATTANLGPGFDSLGLALDLYNEAEMDVLPGQGPPEIEICGEGKDQLPIDEEHLVHRVITDYCRKVQFPLPRLRLRFINRLPLARGLGSSAAARLLGVGLGQLLVHGTLDPKEMLEHGSRLEGHPDNIAPAVLGGLAASLLDGEHVLATQLPLHPDWRILLTIPEFELETEASRRALPEKLPHEDAVFNLVRLPLLLDSLRRGDCCHLAMLSQDRLHQPYRLGLAPGLDEALRAGRDAGACATYLSGAGPTAAAWLCPAHRAQAPAIQLAMERAFADHGIRASSRLLAPAKQGANACPARTKGTR